jgi:hypothetical protein
MERPTNTPVTLFQITGAWVHPDPNSNIRAGEVVYPSIRVTALPPPPDSQEPGQTELAWSYLYDDWVLEWSPQLGPQAMWQAVTEAAGLSSVQLPRDQAQGYFRLRSP